MREHAHIGPVKGLTAVTREPHAVKARTSVRSDQSTEISDVLPDFARPRGAWPLLCLYSL